MKLCVCLQTPKVAAKLQLSHGQQGTQPPVMSDDDKARLQLKLRRQPTASDQQQAPPARTKVTGNQETSKGPVDLSVAASAAVAQSNSLLSAPWQIRAPPEGQWPLGLGAGTNRGQVLQQTPDEKGVLRLISAAGLAGSEDIDLSTVTPKLDGEEQLRHAQLQLQQQFYPPHSEHSKFF